MRKHHKRADFVPAGPITRAVKEWLLEHDLGVATGNRQSVGRYNSPFNILAERTGMGKDALWRHTKNDRSYESMIFDVADRLLCATNRFNWWWDDPELAEV